MICVVNDYASYGDLLSYSIQEWAKAAADETVALSLHPTFIGKRFRDDAWHNHLWRPIDAHHVFFVVDEGYCDLHIDGTRTRFGPGEAFILHPELGPAVHFSPTIHFHEFYFRFTRSGKNLFHQYHLSQVKQAWALSPAIEDLALFLQQGDSLLLRFSVAQILLRFADMMAEQKQRAPRLSDEQCNRIMQWTREHIHLNPEPRDIAQLLQLTPDYCSRIFKQRFEMNLRDWLIRERIQEAARRLLESRDRIEDVAIELGFMNPAHFSRQFKKHMHCTPGAWRRS